MHSVCIQFCKFDAPQMNTVFRTKYISNRTGTVGLYDYQYKKDVFNFNTDINRATHKLEGEALKQFNIS